MAKKILVAGGCSYTDEKYIISDKAFSSEPGLWPMWPEHLSKKLNLECINTGRSGSSNETIFHNVMEKILQYKERVDTVVVMWSEFDRSRFYGLTDWMPLSEAHISLNQNPAFMDDHRGRESMEWRDDMGLGNVIPNFFKSRDFWSLRYNFMKWSLHDSFRHIFTLAEYCKQNNIKYIFMAGLGPFQWQRLNDLAEHMPFQKPPKEAYPTSIKTTLQEYSVCYLKNVWFGSIEKNHKKNLIGWPFDHNFGGYTLDDMRYKGMHPFYKIDGEWNISDIDLHPNADAQAIVADIYYERWLKLYG